MNVYFLKPMHKCPYFTFIWDTLRFSAETLYSVIEFAKWFAIHAMQPLLRCYVYDNMLVYLEVYE